MTFSPVRLELSPGKVEVACGGIGLTQDLMESCLDFTSDLTLVGVGSSQDLILVMLGLLLLLLLMLWGLPPPPSFNPSHGRALTRP